MNTELPCFATVNNGIIQRISKTRAWKLVNITRHKLCQVRGWRIVVVLKTKQRICHRIKRAMNLILHSESMDAPVETDSEHCDCHNDHHGD